MAPRGIVAAAVSSLFSFRLAPYFPAEAAVVPALVFLVIVGTVAIYGLTITPLARALGLALPDPQGVAFVGAHSWARTLGLALRDQGIPVLMLDTNLQNVAAAVNDGLPARRTNVLAEGAPDSLDLGGVGRLLALTPNDEVNALAALNFAELLGRGEVYQLPARPSSDGTPGEGDIPAHLRGRPLFDPQATFPALDARFRAGTEIATVEVNGQRTWPAIKESNPGGIPLFLIRGGRLHVLTGDGTDPNPQSGDRVLLLGADDSVAAKAPA
jgi:hypothetical protein